MGEITIRQPQARSFPPPRQNKSAEEDEDGYYIHHSSAATKPIPLLRPMMKLAAFVLLLWLLPFPLFYFFVGDFHFWRGLALVLYQNCLRDYWRLIYGNSLCRESCCVEISLADQAPNDGRLRARRDNSRPLDHSSSLCRVPGRVQPLPRLIVDVSLGVCWQRPSIRFSRVFSSYLRVRRWWKEPKTTPGSEAS